MVGVLKIDSKEELEQALKIREEVFVDEQNVPKEDEYDQYDQSSNHFLALDAAGLPCGTARWRETEKGIKLERFAVKKEARGIGIGSMLLESVIEDIIVHFEGKPVHLYLHSQISALPLYEKFGFQKEGSEFEECGIKHYKMTKSL